MRVVSIAGRPSFYGCTQYPDCPGTAPLEPEAGIIVDPGYVPARGEDDDEDEEWMDF